MSSKRLSIGLIATVSLVLLTPNKLFASETDLIPQQIKQKIVTNIKGNEDKRTPEQLNQMMKDRYNIQENKVEDDKLKGYTKVNLIISHYSDMDYENGQGAINAQDERLKFGMIAIPRDLPLNTKFYIKGYKTQFVGSDRGSSRHIRWVNNNTMKIDMFVERLDSESDYEYAQRISDLGVKKTIGWYKIP